MACPNPVASAVRGLPGPQASALQNLETIINWRRRSCLDSRQSSTDTMRTRAGSAPARLARCPSPASAGRGVPR